MTTRIKKLLTDSGFKGTNISMRNERLESALAWCKKHKIGSDRIDLFDREYKKKLSGEKAQVIKRKGRK